MYGEFEFLQDLSDDIDLLGELYIKQGGEFRKTAYKLKDNTCSVIETDSVFYPSLGAAFKPSFPEKVKKMLIYRDI